MLTTFMGGCFSSAQSWETTHPAVGVITFKGRPVSNAEISFFPVDESFPDTVRPKAKSTEDGKFVVWTYAQGDGAPSGVYKVTAVHHEVAVSKGTIVAKPNDLPPKLASRDTTTLEVRIEEGKNEITLEL